MCLSCLDCAWMFHSCIWAKGRYHCECLAYVAFMEEHKLLFAAKTLHVPWNELILKRSVYARKNAPSIMFMLKMSYLSQMGAKHVAWCSPVEKSPRSGHMAHELWHNMLCFMGVCNDLLLRIWYPCMISGWYACFWLENDMDRPIHLKWANFW
jgi:hypothetical protein